MNQVNKLNQTKEKLESLLIRIKRMQLGLKIMENSKDDNEKIENTAAILQELNSIGESLKENK